MKKDNIEQFIKKNSVGDNEFELITEYIKLRNEKNISQRDLAASTGLAQSTIARLEKNIHSSSLTNFIKLLNAVGYKIEIKKIEK